MNTWLIEKNSMEYQYLKKKILQSLKYGRYH